MKENPELLKLELKKWKIKSKQKRPKLYWLYFVFVICLAYVVDEIATNINTVMENDIISSLFQNSNSQYVLVATLCSGVSFFTFFYKTYADRFGRKPFLILSNIGLGLGMFILFISRNVAVYTIGLLVVYFFTPVDIQVVYILENASDKHRSFWLSFCKAVGVVGIALVPTLREWAISISWQFVFLIPAIIGVIVGFISLFFVQESEVFMKNRMSYLRKRIKALTHPELPKEKETIADSQGGFIHAIRYMLSDKALIWLFVVGIGFAVCAVAISNYALIMQPNSTVHMSDDMMNQALIVYPFVYAATELIIGFLSDKLGRKKALIFSGSFTCIGLLCFVIGAKSNWISYVTGGFLGLFIGGYYSSLDVFNVMCAERSPTNLRSSILSVINVAISAGNLIGTALFLLFDKIVVQLDVGFFSLILIIPTLFIALLILISKMPETREYNFFHEMKMRKEEKLKQQLEEELENLNMNGHI